MNDDSHSQDKSSNLLLHLIAETIEQSPHTFEIREGSPEERQLAAEAEHLLTNHQWLRETVQALFPDGLPPDFSFYARLEDLQLRLGWTELGRGTVGLLWSEAIQSLPPEAGEELFSIFTTEGNPYFFVLLDTLRFVLRRVALPNEFAAKWFPSFIRRIENDIAQEGFWNALATYCEMHEDSALAVLRLFLGAQEEPELAVAAYILGTLRGLPLIGAASVEFNRLNACFADASSPKAHSIYLRSWIRTAWQEGATRTELESLAARIISSFPNQLDEAIVVFSRLLMSPKLLADAFDFGLAWLRRNVSSSISPVAKDNIIDLTIRLEHDNRCDAADLILAVQPISADDKGTWKRVEHFLVSRLQNNRESFISIYLRLADSNARSWFQMMRGERVFEYLISEMRGKNLSDLVGELLLSHDTACRKLGLFLFEKLDLVSLPSSRFEQAVENELGVIFYELQRTLVGGETVARMIMVLIPHMERVGPTLQAEFFSEIVLQAKNYGGACRTELQKHAEESPLLRKALEEAERYFGALPNVGSSSVSQMEVPGYRQAARLYQRHFFGEVSKKAREFSLLRQLIKNVSLLYGKQSRTYYDGTLGQPSTLQEVSTSMEVPRLEEIDPEFMALRRLQASHRITVLSGSLDDDED